MSRTFLLKVFAPCVLLAAATAIAGEKGRVVTPFNGKDLSGWKLKGSEEGSKWQAGKAIVAADKPAEIRLEKADAKTAELVNVQGGGLDLFTEEKFGDCTVRLEFMVPQGSNSGVYLMGEYEIQIFDSFGKEEIGPGDLGAIYGTAVPAKNFAKKPGEWQTLEIVFQAPRFEGDKKTSNAKFVKVTLNGEVIHENIEAPQPTVAALTGKEAPTGPLMFQGDHGPVAYRKIAIMVKD